MCRSSGKNSRRESLDLINSNLASCLSVWHPASWYRILSRTKSKYPTFRYLLGQFYISSTQSLIRLDNRGWLTGQTCRVDLTRPGRLQIEVKYENCQYIISPRRQQILFVSLSTEQSPPPPILWVGGGLACHNCHVPWLAMWLAVWLAVWLAMCQELWGPCLQVTSHLAWVPLRGLQFISQLATF